MLDRGKRLIEVVQQSFPFLILRRLPKALRVISEGLPMDQEDVLVRRFEAAQQLMRDVARHGRDDGLRFGKGPFEIRAFARADVEDRHFEDHVSIPSADAACAHPLIRFSNPLNAPSVARHRRDAGPRCFVLWR